MGTDFAIWRQAILARTEQALETYLPAVTEPPSQLHQAMRYALLGHGKRIRPLLCHAAGLITGAPSSVLDVAAAALEMVHAYSLVHDDLPAMDNDDLRHGKPAVHIKYGEATALLVGDALQTQAFITLTQSPLELVQQAILVRELAAASGSQGMAGGQMIDLQSVGGELSLAALETMHRMKTGALLSAAVRMGALCGQNADAYKKALDDYAAAIGLAFQVVDDILDVSANSATLGKTAGKDSQNGKPTYVSVLGLEASQRLVKQLHQQAQAALAPLGKQADWLAHLADLVIERAC
ncbi:geranyltranstransferase [Mycoavidus cysteinexigens]|uniref:Geranyltranstransferase n=1 Tax=Mycoavidus cysteinexigens TaxID=1553431 RepID=A0A2Z6EUL7_9BURK|nr:farnesyl diphosphate synthase [Mycoavidus cysteinexigens]BBE09159.1 geranyltranstransferase [Mycoavidus cysteinexigens]GAM52096.1 octaprenyl-diphosphate synthase [bacterium endosymbiont of Mortierella elongata FMR23-6]GLR01894.1 (2E,6E)-farnesyl diphosphate synthase [Mycoavidus cysteinexigens]